MRTVAVFQHDAGVGNSYAALVVVADKLCGLNGTVGIVNEVVLLTAGVGNLAVLKLAREAVSMVAGASLVGIAYYEIVAVAVLRDVHDGTGAVAVIEPTGGELVNDGLLNVVAARISAHAFVSGIMACNTAIFVCAMEKYNKVKKQENA